MALLTAPTSTIEVKAGIRPAIGMTTKAISQFMATLAKEFPEFTKYLLGTGTQILGMAFDAVVQARFEAQLENVDATASISGMTEGQIKATKVDIMRSWGLNLPQPTLATE